VPDGGARLSSVLARSSFLIDGHPVGTRAADAVLLADGAVIEVLPPFAGG
jgi:molybdopterin synthase sulfur carrier subunit